MALHLPYSELPEHEFQMPDGSWHYDLRAIVTDGWLYWRHALPDDPDLRARLDDHAVDRIVVMASALHAAHQRFPGFQDLDDTPFTVGRWWDPSDPDWCNGHRVLLKVNGFNAVALQQQLRTRLYLEIEPISEHWSEIRLKPQRRDRLAGLD